MIAPTMCLSKEYQIGVVIM